MRITTLLLLFLSIILSCQNGEEKNKTKSNQVEQKLYTEADVENKTLAELRIFRNEIFAKYSYIFKSEDLTNHFSNFDWYDPKHENVNHLLTEIDKKNIELILSIEDKIKSMPFKDKILGQWINRKYLNALIETKSPRYAQQLIFMALIEFKSNNESFIVLNFHEGITPNFFIDNELVKFEGEYNKNSVAKLIDFNTLELNYTNRVDTLIRYEVIDSNQMNLAINRIIFKGEYINLKNDKIVEFKENGELTGLEEYINYTVYDDYIDAAMDIDLIKIKSSKGDKKLTWIFENDTLNLYDVKCVGYDSVYNFCYEIDKGKIKYKLLKIN